MTQIKWPLLFLAFAAAACMMGVGVAIGEQSTIGAVISLIVLVFIMGFGFKLKKKYRENGEL